MIEIYERKGNETCICGRNENVKILKIEAQYSYWRMINLCSKCREELKNKLNKE